MARNKNEKAPKGLITRETLISDIAANYIKPVEVMLTYGLHCIGCGASSFDTVETGAALHGMDDEMINKLVDDLLELRAFLQQRLVEETGRTDALSIQQFQNAIHLQLVNA